MSCMAMRWMEYRFSDELREDDDGIIMALLACTYLLELG